jgi:hypothetical protein
VSSCTKSVVGKKQKGKFLTAHVEILRVNCNG